ncbi:HelD family protein [Phytohabitans rumicis]|nr:AAA family ATPase [Phytohabitans rumicis]
MLDTARVRVDTGDAIAGDGYSAETLGRMLRRHVKDLAEEPSSPPYFGRLDFAVEEERYYIGRRHVTDAAGLPMVLDWRAPICRAFYRASARDPMGVAVRRRYGWDPAGRLTGYEDERIGQAAGLSRLVAEEIERPRVGPMRDIVATIQPDQDLLVRADVDESVCVQGAPGTGKTAVGLHRAAYLLYTHRQRLRRGGVLVLGPNREFLRYISAVLPALGEVNVRQSTLDDLLDTGADAVDTGAAAAVKHDARMAQVLRRALYANLAEPSEPLVVPDGSYRWRVSVEALRRVVADVRREALAYGMGRERVRARVVALLQRRAETVDTPGAVWVRRMSHCRAVNGFLDAVWPKARPAEVVARLLGDRAALAAAADGLLTEAEQAVIAWLRPRRARSARWTAADAVLIDEVAGLVEHAPGFGHIIVDEAQDLSPMQCRAVARRSAHGSLTVLGDLAQGTTPWAARSWPELLAHLGKPATPVVPLTTGFRVPAAVLTLANRLVPALGVDVPPAVSLRRDGDLRIQEAPDLAAAAVAAVRAALAQAGSTAVIGTADRLPSIAAALAAAGIEAGGERVTLLPTGLAKGLEYDHVIAVEPAEIVEAEPRGLHRLYVVLTRAVSRLDVLHSRPLPDQLRSSHTFRSVP